MNQMKSILEAGATLALVLVIAVLTACGDEPDNEDTNGPGAAPTETPDNGNEPPEGFTYELVATEKTVPAGDFYVAFALAETDDEYRSIWDEHRFEDEAPDVDWNNEVVIFVATGESGSCPMNLMDVRYDPDESLITVDVSEDVEADTACTDDWTPRSFVIAVEAGDLDEDELYVSLFHSGFNPRELDRQQVRGDVGDAGDAAPTPEQPDMADWAELLISEKAYPESVFDDPLFELVDDKRKFEETWTRFQIDGDPLAIDWDTQVVLFAGTGESSGCPLLLNEVAFEVEHRTIVIDSSTEDPDAMCTADWTPRVFVIAMDRDHLGDGELKAQFLNSDREDEVDPDDGAVIRDE